MTILIFDVFVTSDQTSSGAWTKLEALYDALGIAYETIYWDDMTQDDYDTSWDMIVIPFLEQAGANSYAKVGSELAKFDVSGDTTIPVHIMAARGAHLLTAYSGASDGGSGVSTGEYKVGIIGNWESRTAPELAYFGDAFDTIDGSSVGILREPAGDQLYTTWQRDYDDHPVLWHIGYSASKGQVSVTYDPFMGLQWMCDRQSTPAKNAARKAALQKAAVLLRYDAFDNTDAVTSFTEFQSVVTAAALIPQFGQIVVAALGQGNTQPGDNDSTVANYMAANDISNGGILLHTNHHTALPSYPGGDGTAGTKGPACTSDGAAFDQETTAETGFATSSAKIIGPHDGNSIQLGTNGLGAGTPYVSNANDANVPSATYCETRQMYMWLTVNQAYPADDFGTSTTFTNSVIDFWPGTQAPIICSITIDDIADDGGNDLSVTLNNKIVQVASFGGGALYIHGGLTNMTEFDDWKGFLFGRYAFCPDVLSGQWSTLKSYVDSKLGISAGLAINTAINTEINTTINTTIQ